MLAFTCCLMSLEVMPPCLSFLSALSIRGFIFSQAEKAAARDGKEEHYFMIPAGSRFLAIPEKGEKERKVWDGKNRKAVDV